MIDKIDVSNFCLVIYYDNKTNELAHIEQYTDNSDDIQTDIDSYKYGYNAKIIKPEKLIEQLQQANKRIEGLKEKNRRNFPRCEYLERNLKIKEKEFYTLYKKYDKLDNQLKQIEELVDVILEHRYKFDIPKKAKEVYPW